MKDNLLQYPSDWKNLLNLFQVCFTKPQFNNFCQSTTSMAVSNHASICRWSALFDKKHQSSLNDFFTESPWDDHEVHARLSKLASKRIKDACIGIIDDTMSHKKYAEKMDFLGYFYDGLTKKEQKGHSIVTHGIHSSTLGFVPFDIELYRKNGRSKNDIACSMIERTQHYKKLQLYLVDSWYSNTKVITAIRRHNAHYITEIKSNRNVTIGKRKGFAREHEKHISAWKKCNVKNSLYRYFQTYTFIESIGNVNLVFSQRYDADEKKWTETYYLITDITSLSGESVIELFLLRGGIEGFHREAKQQLGMEQYQLRNSRGIERYLFLVLLVFTLLMLLNKQQMRETFLQKSIGEMREHLKAECYTTVLQNARHFPREHLEEFGREMAHSL